MSTDNIHEWNEKIMTLIEKYIAQNNFGKFSIRTQKNVLLELTSRVTLSEVEGPAIKKK
jgi:hypothetical protein